MKCKIISFVISASIASIVSAEPITFDRVACEPTLASRLSQEGLIDETTVEVSEVLLLTKCDDKKCADTGGGHNLCVIGKDDSDCAGQDTTSIAQKLKEKGELTEFCRGQCSSEGAACKLSNADSTDNMDAQEMDKCTTVDANGNLCTVDYKFTDSHGATVESGKVDTYTGMPNNGTGSPRSEVKCKDSNGNDVAPSGSVSMIIPVKITCACS